MRLPALFIIGLAALLLLVAAGTEAVFLRLKEPTPTCFIEEVADPTEVVLVQYILSSSESEHFPTIATIVTPVSKKIILTKQLRGQGTFSFTPLKEELGPYEVCFVYQLGLINTVSLDLQVLIDHHDRRRPATAAPAQVEARRSVTGEQPMDVMVFTDSDGEVKETLRTHDYFDRVARSLNHIEGLTEEIGMEVTYFIQRQARMRATAESSFERVWLLAAITIAAVVGLSVAQYSYLRIFLKKKKLV
jgi:hypothetical protein